MDEFEKYKLWCIFQHEGSPTVDGMKDRDHKDLLYIHNTIRPDLFLTPDVASSHLVKHLDLNMSKDILWNPEMISYDDFKHILKVWNNTDEELEKLASTYPKLCFYTSTLCKDIVNLNNLEIIYLDDLKLSTDLWLEFIKNNQK